MTGSLSVTVTIGDGSSPFSLSGNFTFEQITLATGVKAVRIGAAQVSANVLGVTLSGGQGGFVFMPTGIAGSMSVRIDAGDPGIAAVGGNVILQINNTGQAVDQTISVGNTNIAIKFSAAEGKVVRFAILNATISIRRSST